MLAVIFVRNPAAYKSRVEANLVADIVYDDRFQLILKHVS
jgi:hypothetical protein